MMKHCDVAIVGAGIIGLSIAWQLARRSNLRIAVVEKGAAVGEGSTGASSAICRVRYSIDETLVLARDGISAYRHWAAFTRLRKPAADFHEDGVLWMPGSDREWADREVRRMQGFGVAAEVLEDDDVAERFPALSTCTLPPDLETGEAHDCVGGSRNLFEIEGGHVDPVAAARDLVEACRNAGVEVRFRRRVTGIGVAGGRVASVSFDDGSGLATPLLINAVDSTIGGVLIRGHKGTAKSTAVRALARLLPSIDVVPGCAFHCDPDDTGAMHHECRQRARGLRPGR